MSKIKNWFKAHKPTKRRLIQIYAALLFNANLKGFATGKIYTGDVKSICSPGLGCYSCPAATGACPLGSLQNSIVSANKSTVYYVFGIIMLYGLLLGRWICGFLCPFGLIQELLHKIPTPKIRKGKFTRVLSFFKYFVLIFFVGLIPIAYAVKDFPLPGFCKYICPVGTLEGALGLLSNELNTGYLRMLGPLFTWKFALMVSFLVACVFIFRFFCRFLCPLGALYGLFNKISFVGVRVDKKSCSDCGICVNKCKMDIKHVGDNECISCGECIDVCPTKAIVWKGSKFTISPSLLSLDESASEEEIAKAKEIEEKRNKKIKKRNNIIKTVVAVLMIAVLAASLVYYNFIDRDEVTNGIVTEATCPDFEIDILCSDEKFVLSENRGRVVIVNFWFTTCTPCVEELPHFNEVAEEYKDEVVLLAIHIEQELGEERVNKWLEKLHPEWIGSNMIIAWDTDKKCEQLFEVNGTCPTTVIIDGNGVITGKFSGAMTKDELISEVKKALGK